MECLRDSNAVVAIIVLSIYTISVITAVLYTAKEVVSIFKTSSESLKKHKLVHVVILLLLISFNIALVATDTKGGALAFFDLLKRTGALFQYILMSGLIYVAGRHLSDEIAQLEGIANAK